MQKTRLSLRALEDRRTPTVTATVDGGVLNVTGDNDGDAIAVTDAGGSVLVNGVDPAGGPEAAADITEINVDAGGGNDTLDLTGVDTAEFTSLATIAVKARGGDDSFRVDAGTVGVASYTFDGEGGTDIITIDAADVTSVAYDLGAGTLTVDGAAVVGIAGLEQVDDRLNSTDRAFNYSDAGESLTVTEVAASPTAFIDFAHPAGGLTLNAGGATTRSPSSRSIWGPRRRPRWRSAPAAATTPSPPRRRP